MISADAVSIDVLMHGVEEADVKMWFWHCAGFIGAGALVFAPGCANGSDNFVTGTVETSRVVGQSKVDFAAQPSHAERFGLMGSSRSKADPHAAATGDAKAPFAWKTPGGWTELPSSSMRVANFRPAGDERAECYLTVLAGEAGGLTANINRWRSQLSLTGLSAADVEQLPRVDFLGRKAVVAEGTGTWTGMSGGESKSDWALLALALVEPGGSVFLKMTGPKNTIAAQREAFFALAASFGSPGTSQPQAESSAGGFTFDLPNAWRSGADKASRALSFWAGEGEAVECYVTVLGGTAGGELANVNRWRTQVGLASIDQASLDALDPFTMLDRPAKIIELVGENSAISGITCMGEDRSVFVKMTGPVELVRKQRSAMLAFASSLREATSR